MASTNHSLRPRTGVCLSSSRRARSPRVRLLLATALFAALASLCAPEAALAQIDIDSFTSGTPQATPPNSEVGATVIGGFRDVKSNNASNVASADGGRFRCSGTAAFQGCTVQWDGNDGDPVTFTPGGFTAVDFTAGGQDRIEVPTFVDAGVCNLFFEVCDDDFPTPQCDSVAVPGIANGGTVTMLYTDFDPGLDFTAVTALQLALTPTSAPVNCSVGAIATGPVPLIFEDGFESGDTTAWSATVP